jgi:acyl-CoA synthetase (AMP-forming)/AMP-acid ligase II
MVHIISSPHTPPPLPRSSVFDYLFPPANAKEYYPKPDPASTAFIDGLTGEEVTRGQVEEQAIKLASGLKGLGIKRGDVGMTFGFNSLQYINAIMGIQAAGAIVSPANAA